MALEAGLEKDYIINFSSLSMGENELDFKVDKKFFEGYENEDILEANISLRLNVLKEERMLSFYFHFQGIMRVLCDRCLEPLDIDIKSTNSLFVKFGQEFLEQDDDVIIVPVKENKIDITQYIYDYILLQKPIRSIHKEGDCNKDMLERISKQSETIQEIIDPRWSSLKDIKFE
jgi:uncharacterized metal-binding protein YceD (DUF177 family)